MYDFNLCQECNNYLIKIEEKGEVVCSQCGLVLYEREFNLSQHDRRIFCKEEIESKCRTGPLISNLLPDLSLYTFISKKRLYNPNLKRARKLDSFRPWKTRNILIAYTELRRISTILAIPDFVKGDAFKYYKKAAKHNMLKGRSIKSMVAACIYLACRTKCIPITIKEILLETNETKESLKKCYKSLLFEFNIKVPNSNPFNFITKFISNLGLDFEIEKATRKIIKLYLEKGFKNGKNPKGICAGALYLASKLRNIHINQKDIANVVGVSITTLRARYNEILNQIDLFNLN